MLIVQRWGILVYHHIPPSHGQFHVGYILLPCDGSPAQGKPTWHWREFRIAYIINYGIYQEYGVNFWMAP